MVIGVDFDNTIVCYDELFHRVGVEQRLIPSSVPATKQAVRRHLEESGRGDAWTELQGYVYGVRLAGAPVFPGVLECFRRWSAAELPVYIISHKTRFPAKGPPYDLHEAAQQWLETQGFYDSHRIGLRRDRVFFERNPRAKVRRIAQVGCTVFIDDLPEVLLESGFPATAQRILFDPHRQHAPASGLDHATSWPEIERLIQCRNRPF